MHKKHEQWANWDAKIAESICMAHYDQISTNLIWPIFEQFFGL